MGLQGDRACRRWPARARFHPRQVLQRRLPCQECNLRRASDRDSARGWSEFTETRAIAGRARLQREIPRDGLLAPHLGWRKAREVSAHKDTKCPAVKARARDGWENFETRARATRRLERFPACAACCGKLRPRQGGCKKFRAHARRRPQQ